MAPKGCGRRAPPMSSGEKIGNQTHTFWGRIHVALLCMSEYCGSTELIASEQASSICRRRNRNAALHEGGHDGCVNGGGAVVVFLVK